MNKIVNCDNIKEKYKLFNLSDFDVLEIEEELDKLNLELCIKDKIPYVIDKINKEEIINIDGFCFKFKFKPYKNTFVLKDVTILQTVITNDTEFSLYVNLIRQIQESVAHINLILYSSINER